MANYEQFVKWLGRTFQWKVCPKSNTFEFRGMTGPEKIKIFVFIEYFNFGSFEIKLLQKL